MSAKSSKVFTDNVDTVYPFDTSTLFKYRVWLVLIYKVYLLDVYSLPRYNLNIHSVVEQK